MTKKPFNVDEHLKNIEQNAKNAPSPEEIISEFKRGDYSSLDPELRKEIEERERLERQKKVARPKEVSP